MIDIANGIKLFDKKIEYQAIRSNGPGGQHVNKVSTAIILKYNLNVHNYPEWFLKSIKINANNAQLSNKNIITIKSNRFRSQLKNKRDATSRLISLLKRSSKRKKSRKKTLPTKKSIETRLLRKKINSKKKILRKKPDFDD
ncbi:MAG: aminoacyl-tRNA hydrolase [Candidatus Neomarinimicrobiota bacterium]|nr:MAG: aminoacyl-tRNA hydrolase [Candidatus Neomarinimicrobiota bacterium]